MLNFRRILISSGILLAILVAVIAIIISANMKDQKVDPDYFAIMNPKSITIPAYASDGFKFLLGLRVATHEQDPFKKGEEIYKAALKQVQDKTPPAVQPDEGMPIPDLPADLSFINAGYISKQKWSEHKDAISTYLLQTEKHLKRFNNLIDYKAYALDQKPTFSFLGAPINYYFKLSRIKLAQLNQLLHQGKGTEFLDELVQINNFAVTSLQYPDTLLGVMINVALLRNIRENYNEALKEYPQLKKQALQYQLEPPPSFDSIVQNTLYTEANYIYSLLHSDTDIAELISPTVLSDDFQDPYVRFLVKNFSFALPLFYKPNTTFNLFMREALANLNDPCVKTQATCPDEPLVRAGFFQRTLINPIGSAIATSALGITSFRFKKLYKDLSEMQ